MLEHAENSGMIKCSYQGSASPEINILPTDISVQRQSDIFNDQNLSRGRLTTKPSLFRKSGGVGSSLPAGNKSCDGTMPFGAPVGLGSSLRELS